MKGGKMTSLAKVLLLFALVFFLHLIFLCIRLLYGDGEAVEIDLHEIEKRESETSSPE